MNPIIIHHNDDDGRCAAAIIINEIIPIFIKDQINTIEYSYRALDWDAILGEVNPGGIAFIVDVSLNDEIFGIIKYLVEMGVNVTHIDHHQGTLDYINEIKNPICKEVFDKIRHFYRTDLSATMLCWVYSCMNGAEHDSVDDVDFDFSEGFTHVMINPGNRINQREYRIPPVVKFIDDYDIWRHSTPDTMKFHYGFSLVDDKSPKSTNWVDIIYDSTWETIGRYIDQGDAILKYKKNDGKLTMMNGWETEIDNASVFVVNRIGDTFMFESVIDYYDVCIGFQYQKGVWKYSLRSAANSEFDCNKFAQKYGGGGHFHAAGFTSSENLFIK